jgi:hypothetical protein
MGGEGEHRHGHTMQYCGASSVIDTLPWYKWRQKGRGTVEKESGPQRDKDAFARSSSITMTIESFFLGCL